MVLVPLHVDAGSIDLFLFLDFDLYISALRSFVRFDYSCDGFCNRLVGHRCTLTVMQKRDVCRIDCVCGCLDRRHTLVARRRRAVLISLKEQLSNALMQQEKHFFVTVNLVDVGLVE